MSFGVASGGTSKPISVSTSTLSGVAIATWAAATPASVLHGAADLEQGHRVGVRAGAQLDVGVRAVVMRRGLLRSAGGRVRGGRRASSPAPEVCADRGQVGGAVVLGGRAERGQPAPRTRGAPRRAGRSRAGSRRAAWCGRRCARTAASTSGVGTPAARWTASQPHRTSSPSGVSPSPRPTSPATASASMACGWSRLAVAAEDRSPGAESRDVRTSTDRPTASGLPSRWRTPSATYAERSRASRPEVRESRPERARDRAAPAADHADAPAGDLDVHGVAARGGRSAPARRGRAEQVADPRRSARGSGPPVDWWNDGALMLPTLVGAGYGLPM